MLAGLVTIWSWVRARVVGKEDEFWVLGAESIIAVPWLLFPPMFGLALVGGFRPALITVQVGLAIAGATGLWARRTAVRGASLAAAQTLRREWPTLLALAAVVLFVLWAWLMPFPESFNGHQHGPLSRLSELWRSGSYPELPKSWVGYDTEVFSGPPQHVFLLSLFSLPGVDSIGLRPIFLLPGLFALITLQLLRLACGEFFGRRELGSVAFLLACFSYFAASNFTQITEDMLTPLILSYTLLQVGRWVVGRRLDWFPFVLVIVMTALVRPQLFLLLLAVGAAMFAARWPRWDQLREAARRRSGWLTAGVVAAVLLPLATWMVFDAVRYGSPVFPTLTESRTAAFSFLHVHELFDTQLDGRSLLLSEFLPLYGFGDLGTFGKNVFSGLSFSIALTVSIIGFLFIASRWAGRERGRLLRRLALAIAAAFLLVLYLVFPAYPKYSDYGAFLLAPFAAAFLVWLAGFRVLKAAVAAFVVAVFVAGLGFWAYNDWGHEASDTGFTNVKFLWPGYGSPIDRLARASGRTPESLVMESEQYTHALATLRPGQHILLLDLEPGALIPSLLDREFVGNEPYLETPAGHAILAAKTDRELKRALHRLRIQYVYEPGRPHPEIERTLIMRRLAAYDGDAHYLIPAQKLIRGN